MSQNIPRHYQSQDAQIRNFTGIVFEDVEIEPYNGSSFNTTTRKIQFRLPRTGILDSQKSFLKADVNCTGGSSGHLWSHFNRLKVFVGNVLVVDEFRVGDYYTKQMDAYLMTDEVNSCNTKSTGYRQTQSDSTTQTKYAPLSQRKWLKRNFFSKKLPLFKMNQVIIEYEIWDNLNIFTSGDTSAIVVDNCKLKLHILDGPELRKQYSGEIKGTFLTHEHHYRSITNSATKINEIVPAHYNNVNFVLLQQNATADADLGITAPAERNFSSISTLNSMNNIELSIDGEKFPKNPIKTDDAVEIADNLRKCWLPNSGMLGDVIHNYDDRSDESNMYVGIPLASELKAVSGQKLSNKSGSIIVKADISAAAASDLNIYVSYNRFYKIAGDGAMSVIE